MSKYIKLEDAINAIEDKIAEYIPTLYWRYGEIPLELRMAIEHLPTIDIVHCEDCRLATYTVKNMKINEIFYACPYSSIHNGGKSFCAYGERKDDE